MMLKQSETVARELVMSALAVWAHGEKTIYIFHDDDPVVPKGKYVVVKVEVKDIEPEPFEGEGIA